MKISVLGTGSVGDTIGSRLVELGYNVMMGSRTIGNEKALGFVAKHGTAKAAAGTFADAAQFADIIFNCTKGEHSLEALKSAAAHLPGKIIVDVANPLDFSTGKPPSLLPALSNTNSLGEEIQKQFLKARVVKTLNTMWCGVMVNPAIIKGGEHTNFICGNDAEAKQAVKKLLIDFGWKNENLLDLGDISAARGTEAVLPVWLRIWGATQNGVFNLKVVS